MNFEKNNLKKLNEKLKAQIPDETDDEILDKNYQKIDLFSEMSFVTFSQTPLEVRKFEVNNLSSGRNFLMTEITKENLPMVLNMLQRASRDETDDQILDKNFEKIDIFAEDKPELAEMRRGKFHFTPDGKIQKPAERKSRKQSQLLTKNGISNTFQIDQEMDNLISSFENKGKIIQMNDMFHIV